ncbi:MAG: hypothetical protein C4318_07360 [Acidimicrobiia bacterium]
MDRGSTKAKVHTKPAKSLRRFHYIVPILVVTASFISAIVVQRLSSGNSPPASKEPVPTVVANAGPVAVRAYAFLMSKDLAGEPLDVLVLDFVGRRFGIDTLRSFTSRAVENLIDEEGPNKLYVRLVLPASELPERVRSAPLPTLEAAGSIVYYPVVALNCDRFPLQPAFLDGLRSEAPKGGYRSTHSALALLWGYEQGCIDRTSTTDLYNEHLRVLSETIATESFPGDLYVEALALYEFMSEEPVPESILDRVAQVQLEDGSIPYSRSEPMGSTHATTLALWGALEHSDPERSPDGWIVAPGPPAGPPLVQR